MANQITGTIVAMSKRDYQKMDGTMGYSVEVVLDCSQYDQYSGEKRENYPSVDVTSSKFEEWKLQKGMRVRFDIAIEGRYVDKKDGSGKMHINNIKAYKMEVMKPIGQGMQQGAQMQQGAAQYGGQLMQQYPPLYGQTPFDDPFA